MAKPINPYQGPAPAAMSQMGQGLLEVGANIGRTLQSGYESMGRGIAGGISAVAEEYARRKEDQAKFDATKKMFSAFESYLPKQIDPQTGKEISPIGDKVRSIFEDTSMSVREKNQLAPMLMNMLSQAQQQQGRENVANIMAGSREAVAGMKNQPPAQRPAYTIGNMQDIFSSPVNPPADQPNLSGSQVNLPPSDQGNMTRNVSAETKTRRDPVTGKLQFWSPEAKRWVDDLVFGPDFRIVP